MNNANIELNEDIKNKWYKKAYGVITDELDYIKKYNLNTPFIEQKLRLRAFTSHNISKIHALKKEVEEQEKYLMETLNNYEYMMDKTNGYVDSLLEIYYDLVMLHNEKKSSNEFLKYSKLFTNHLEKYSNEINNHPRANEFHKMIETIHNELLPKKE